MRSWISICTDSQWYTPDYLTVKPCNFYITPFSHPANRNPFHSPLFLVDVAKEERMKLHLIRARGFERTGCLLDIELSRGSAWLRVHLKISWLSKYFLSEEWILTRGEWFHCDSPHRVFLLILEYTFPFIFEVESFIVLCSGVDYIVLWNIHKRNSLTLE